MRASVDIPQTALDAVAQAKIKNLGKQVAALSRKVAAFEKKERDAGTIREAMQLVEECAANLRHLGFADWD